MGESTPAPSPLPGTALRRVERHRGSGISDQMDVVAEEVPIAMTYNATSFAVMMATPYDLEDFALGFSLSEGLIDEPSELLAVAVHTRLEGIELAMTVSAKAPAATLDAATTRLLAGHGGCGLCGTRQLEDALRRPPRVPNSAEYPAPSLRKALAALPQNQPINSLTGASHAAAWVDRNGDIRLLREDVGRHNALDKLTGAMRRQGLATDDGLLLISSRASYEMISKAAFAGIGIVAAVSAPTALAIDLARSADICLVGFARSGGYNVYACPERLSHMNPE